MRWLLFFTALWLLQFLIFKFALVEAGIVLLSTNIFPIFGKDLYAKLIKGFFELERLLVDLGVDGIVQLAVVPAELYLVKYLLHELVLAFIVLSADKVEIGWLLDDGLVIFQAQGCVRDGVPLCGTGLRKGADYSIMRSPWMILTTRLLSSLSMGVMDLDENIPIL